jgi:LemA protein
VVGTHRRRLIGQASFIGRLVRWLVFRWRLVVGARFKRRLVVGRRLVFKRRLVVGEQFERRLVVGGRQFRRWQFGRRRRRQELVNPMREEKLTPEQAQEVIREAVRLQQEQENAVDAQTLEASAAEIGVDPQHLRDALRKVAREREQRAQRLRYFLIALGVCAALFVGALFASQRALSAAWAEVQLKRAQLENVQQRKANLMPRLEQLMQQVNQQQREKLQVLADALRQNPTAANTLAQQLLQDPALQSDWLVVRLMDEITGSENRIAVERKRFEEAAARYEQTARRFPISLMRPLLGYPRTVERPQ